MATKSKCPTPAHESSHSDSSSGKESRTDSVPRRAEVQQKEDKKVENAEGEANESSGEYESEESGSDDEAAKQEPAKPLQQKKSSSDSNSSNESSGEYESEESGSNKEAAKQEPAKPLQQKKSSSDSDSSNESSGEYVSESESDDEAAKQEPTKPLQQKKSSSDSDSDSSNESNPKDGTRTGVESVAVAATKEDTPVKKPAGYQQLNKQPASTHKKEKKHPRKDGDAEGEEEPSGSESHDEAAKHELPKKRSPDSDSSSESEPEDETCAVKAVAASKAVTPVKKPAISQRLKKRPTKRLRKGSDADDGAGDGAAVQHSGEGLGYFQRLWSENDEIKLLQGMIKFRKEERLEASTNVRVFRDFLNKKSVRFDFAANESQFHNKIRHMKVKFMNGCKVGRIWKKPHDQKLSELSNVLWGGGNGGEIVHSPLKKSKTPESSGKIAAAPSKLPEEFKDSDWASKSSLLQLTSMGLDEEVLRIGMGMIDSLEMEELKDRWRQLRMSELQVANDRATLMNHQAKLFMDGYRRVKRQV